MVPVRQVLWSPPLYKLGLTGHNPQPSTELGIGGAHHQTQGCDSKLRILSTSGVKEGGPDCCAVTGPPAVALPEHECGVNLGGLADQLGSVFKVRARCWRVVSNVCIWGRQFWQWCGGRFEELELVAEGSLRSPSQSSVLVRLDVGLKWVRTIGKLFPPSSICWASASCLHTCLSGSRPACDLASSTDPTSPF